MKLTEKALEAERGIYRDKCRYYEAYKVLLKPRCGCRACWKKWDDKHNTARSADCPVQQDKRDF